LAELKEAGIGRKEALSVGIVVDHRRRNLSEEGKKLNVERLRDYKTRLLVFPRKAGKAKKGDSSVRGFNYHVNDRWKTDDYLFRRMISRKLLQPGLLLHYLRHTMPRLLEKSPTRNVSLRHTGLFVQSVPTPDMRVYVRLVLPRFVSSHSILCFAQTECFITFTEGGGGCCQKEINTLTVL